MNTAIDSNVLFDILSRDPEHYGGSVRQLSRQRSIADLIVGEVVYAELAPWFEGPTSLNQFLSALGISIVMSSGDALHRAGVAFRRYARERGAFRCAECGAALDSACPQCGSRQTRRQHIVADFMIGAHALVHAGRLLTRDRGYFATYFPDLELV